jgi:hypothetical protein
MTEKQALYAAATDPLPWTCPHCGQVLGSVQNKREAIVELASGMFGSVRWADCAGCGERVWFGIAVADWAEKYYLDEESE